MRYRQRLAWLLLIFLPLSAKALPAPSSAGGNYLALDGVDDYAVLDFEAFGLLLPEGTNEFTIDAWIYPTTPPDENTEEIIFHQQARMVIVNDEYQPLLNNLANAFNIKPPQGDFILLMNAYIEGKPALSLPFPIPLEPNQWHHIAYQSNGLQTTTIVNDVVKTMQQDHPLLLDTLLGFQSFQRILCWAGWEKELRSLLRKNCFFMIPSRDILMRSASRGLHVMMLRKRVLCQRASSRMMPRQWRCGILMSLLARRPS